MRKMILRLTGVMFFAACVPAFAQVPTMGHYATALTILGDSGPYTGSLVLDTASDGTVRGYYFNSDYTSLFAPVVGARTGDDIWFDIDSGELIHVQGHIRNGVIEGGALGESSRKTYSFTATPQEASRLY